MKIVMSGHGNEMCDHGTLLILDNKYNHCRRCEGQYNAPRLRFIRRITMALSIAFTAIRSAL